MRLSVVIPLLVAVVVAGYWLRQRRRGRPAVAGRLMLLGALASTVLISVLLLPELIHDGGLSDGAVPIVIGPPILIAALPVLVEWFAARAAIVVTGVAAVLMFGYVLVYGLGAGSYYSAVPLLLVVAALTLRRPGPARRPPGHGAGRPPPRRTQRPSGRTPNRS